MTLFGENSEGSAQYRAEVSLIASRLATVFASLKVSHHWKKYHTPAAMHGTLVRKRTASQSA